MQPEFADPGRILEILIQQEETLQFDQFTPEDGWRLGMIAREHAIRHGGDLAIDVTAHGVILFRCTVGVATPNNTRWIRRKSNVTLESWKSSLRALLDLRQAGRTPAEFGWAEADFVLAGGSFPLRVHGQGVIGTLTVSGLPQTHDHQLTADALAEMLHKAVPSILP